VKGKELDYPFFTLLPQLLWYLPTDVTGKELDYPFFTLLPQLAGLLEAGQAERCLTGPTGAVVITAT
jgi:hypothetical protein